MIKPNEYRCGKCKQIFTKTREDKEALEEFKDNFPNVPLNESAVVCHDCYLEIMSVWEEIKESRRRMR